jgi:uncharacterized membrane protein YphA (DoxX/SURF4 family)
MASNLVSLVGRVLFVAVFLLAAVDHISSFNKQVSWVESELGSEIKEFPADYVPYVFGFAIALQLIGSFLVIIDQKLGYLLLIGFLVPVTFIVHDFWDHAPDSANYKQEIQGFLHNVALAGAALALYAANPVKVRPPVTKSKAQ